MTAKPVEHGSACCRTEADELEVDALLRRR
jgi:hypothetical protein